jgi:hypothetical protein
MNLIFLILIHLIPISLMTTICLSLIFLTILRFLPAHAVMILVSAWLGWKLKSNAGAALRQNRPLVSLLR